MWDYNFIITIIFIKIIVTIISINTVTIIWISVPPSQPINVNWEPVKYSMQKHNQLVVCSLSFLWLITLVSSISIDQLKEASKVSYREFTGRRLWLLSFFIIIFYLFIIYTFAIYLKDDSICNTFCKAGWSHLYIKQTLPKTTQNI